MEVLPTSIEIASTAVPVEISYNNDNNPDRAFIAVIEGISSIEYAKDIEELFDAYRQYDKVGVMKDGADGEVDNDMYQPMMQVFDKIKWLYPGLNDIDDLKTTTARKLLDEPHVKKILDAKISIHAAVGETRSFADRVKHYIECSKISEGQTSSIPLWPLVKVVKIYVKADILKFGLTLVDLPGTGDTCASRVEVTEKYRKNLTASVICSEATRAASEKAAQDLLSSFERRDMQLDGLYTSDSIFIVITKIDDMDNFLSYIEAHPRELKKATEQDRLTIISTEEQMKQMSAEVATRRPKHEMNEQVLEKM